MRQCTSYACNFINFKKSFFLQIPGNQSFRRIANGTTCAGGYSEASQSVRSTGSAHSGGAPRSRSRPMTGGGATGGSSSAAAEGTAVDALGRAVGDLRMGTMGTPLDSPPGELGAAEDVRHREHLWQQRDCPAPRRALRRGTRSFSYQYQERLRKAAEADAAARRAGRSAVFREAG